MLLELQDKLARQQAEKPAELAHTSLPMESLMGSAGHDVAQVHVHHAHAVSGGASW